MNFFGHAVIASRRSASAGFVLGAMLPDFATMLGARVPVVTNADMERGVAFHHATDKAFHEAPTFRALQSEARAALRARGLPRPGALAVGHIGVEMLLDRVLAEDTRGVAAYLAALQSGPSFGAYIAWKAGELGQRFEELCSILAARGVSAGDGDARTTAFRVASALASRPRLRLDAGGERIVESWANEAQLDIAAAAPALLSEVDAGLRDRISRHESAAIE